MSEKKLYKIKKPGTFQVGGICEGLGEYFNQDPIFFRIGFVILSCLGGVGILAYFLLYFVLPTKKI